MNGEGWTELDRRKNDTHLAWRFNVYSFDIEKTLECRYLRLTQTEENDRGSHSLELCAIEIFGHLSRGSFPLTREMSLDGIISYLTRKHDGNVQDKGIVLMTSKSARSDDPRLTLRNVTVLTDDSQFWSEDQPGQWVCWDFRELRILPTHYTLRSYPLKSWVVEGSLDGRIWTEIDRRRDDKARSFAVAKSTECRFIRLAQTGKSRSGSDRLIISAVEFFGTLFEW
jgi:hypothetical protein